VVALLEATSIRVGNDEYSRDNDTYGLTTVRDRHVTVTGARIHFDFQAKGGVDAQVSVVDSRLARVVRACQALPGYEVFKWVDEEGVIHDAKSEDVNQFIRELSGGDFTAKYFRTWVGTLHAFCHLSACGDPDDEKEADAQCIAAVDAVAERLRNTRAVARSSYIHPAVLDGYRQGALGKHVHVQRLGGRNGTELDPSERMLLDLLETLDLDA
jgi:DNA topoisomerase-1